MAARHTGYTLTCSCGWTHDAIDRKSATLWKAWHRRQHQRPGQRLSDGGHVVTIAASTTADDGGR